MDERQAQIREGAGLDEARLNVEFIDFLKKWSTPLLVVIAVIALGYFGLQKRREMKTAALAAAFAELDAARDAGNPTNLLAVADEHRGQGAVAHIAELGAADIFLASYRAGVRPGGRVDGAGKPEDEADLLSEADRTTQLNAAADLYKKVLDDSAGKIDFIQHTIGALFGLTAVAECRLNFDEARKHLDTIESLAKTADMPEYAELAKQRAETLPLLATMPRLYARAEIPVSMAGQLPEGVVPIPNPFANQPATDGAAPVGPAVPVGPEGPTAPGADQPVVPVPVQEPESGIPGATPPVEEPTEAPKEEPKPADKPADPPKTDPNR